MHLGRHAATALILASTVVATPALAEKTEAAVAATDRKPVADFTLPTLDGQKLKFSSTRGKVVLVSFWATWCGPCKQELPLLNTVSEKYASQGLMVLSINTDSSKTSADVRRVVKAKGLTLPILLDADGAVSGRLNPGNAMPLTIYIDRAGLVAHTHEGFQPGDEKDIEARIEALLAEPAPAKP